MEQARIVKSAAEMRALARRGEWLGTTAGHCSAYQQANLVILPREAAPEFAAFCTRNPKPCPLIEITPPGDPEPARSAPGADLRTDVGGYRVYRDGKLTEQRKEIRDLWRDDLVAFEQSHEAFFTSLGFLRSLACAKSADEFLLLSISACCSSY